MERLVQCSPDVTLCIDEFGRPGDPLVVQLEGHMAQLIATSASYCAAVADEGFHVVRVDNRDVGGSSRAASDYDLTALADDVHALIGRLGGPAVVCGRSMGGAVAQLLALRHPGDVTGLGLFFTFAKDADWPLGDDQPAPFGDEASFVAWEQASLPRIAGPDHPFDPAWIDAFAREQWARGVSWAGFERQRRAMALTAPWASELSALKVPTAIVHGVDDPVIPVEAGRRLADLIPGATLTLVDGLGHQQPPELDDVFVAATLRAAGRT